jgi:hypothetical protein
VRLSDVLYEREAEAGAGYMAVFGRRYTIKPFKDPILFLLGDSHPMIDYLYDGLAVLTEETQSNIARLAGVFDRIVQQIQYREVDPRRGQARGGIPPVQADIS